MGKKTALPPALVYTEDYLKYDFGPSHPLRPVRVRLFYELLKLYSVIDGKRLAEFKVPPVKTDGNEGESLKKTIELAHDPEYVHRVKMMSDSGGIDPMNEGYIYGLGPGDNPVFSGMYEAAAVHVISTVISCDIALDGKAERTFSPGGGFHHAQRRKASGFCIFNDAAVAIKNLIEKRDIKRVMYLDIDAHHGDGVQWAFYDDPRVLTISIHQDPRTLFPGTGYLDETGEGKGVGYSVNLPVPPGTFDDAYLYGFREIVPPLAKAFKPEIIVAQLGADTHYTDPLTNIKLTTKSYIEIGREIDRLIRDLGSTKFVGISGGGYDVTATARAWVVLLGGIAGYETPNELPEEWVKYCEKACGENPGRTLLDAETGKPGEELDKATMKMIPEIIEKNVETLRKTIFPVHGIGKE